VDLFKLLIGWVLEAFSQKYLNISTFNSDSFILHLNQHTFGIKAKRKNRAHSHSHRNLLLEDAYDNFIR
jgi:hypothetical protein